jgi:hypothetical protein
VVGYNTSLKRSENQQIGVWGNGITSCQRTS